MRLSCTSSGVSCSLRKRSNEYLSSSAIRSLCIKKLSREISARKMRRSIPYASSNVSPSTPFSDTNTTGNLPIYASHSAFSLEIASPLNSVLSVPISKKDFSMLMFSVLPKRRGRVKRFTLPQLFSRSRISPVLST